MPTLSYGGADGGGDSGGDGGGDAPAAAADKTIFKLKVTGFGDKAKIKVCTIWYIFSIWWRAGCLHSPRSHPVVVGRPWGRLMLVGLWLRR